MAKNSQNPRERERYIYIEVYIYIYTSSYLVVLPSYEYVPKITLLDNYHIPPNGKKDNHQLKSAGDGMGYVSSQDGVDSPQIDPKLVHPMKAATRWAKLHR